MECKIVRIKPYETLKDEINTIKSDDFELIFECSRFAAPVIENLMKKINENMNISYDIFETKKDDVYVIVHVACHRKN